MNFKNNVNFLFEVSSLRHVDRTWKQFFDDSVANNAEHIFRVIWIALTLAKMEGAKNHEKILKMAMVHDLPESRAGDVHYLSRQYVERKQTEAARDMFAGTVHEAEMLKVFEEYEKRDCLEAKIVKDADTLDIELETKEYEAKGFTIRQKIAPQRKAGVYTRLFTKSAKKMWDEIDKTDPHDWHNQSPKNRHLGGDWKVDKKKKS
ncbi:MAG: HD domain-containing protein [Candidatus Paceibacterota bacterium]|jgi:putative hydrolase of HD superfamily